MNGSRHPSIRVAFVAAAEAHLQALNDVDKMCTEIFAIVSTAPPPWGDDGPRGTDGVLDEDDDEIGGEDEDEEKGHSG